MIRAKHFSIQEYVPRHIYELRGEKAWELIDPRLILLNDTIREFINSPMVINTWHSEGLVRLMVTGNGQDLERQSFTVMISRKIRQSKMNTGC